MLRVLARRRVLVAAVVAAGGVHEASSKLPIYPRPDPEILLQETPSELEKQIGAARRAVTTRYLDAHARVQGVVSRWISVEEAVEARVKSLIAPDEPLTPGLLYVGVATLTGSVLARNRLLWRLTLPPALFLLSLNHFLPKTTSNVSDYLGELEDEHFPVFARKHDVSIAHTSMTWEMAKDAAGHWREAFENGVAAALGRVENTTGLKFREALGWGKGAVREAEVQARAVADAAKEAVEGKVEVAKEAVERKVEEVKRSV